MATASLPQDPDLDQLRNRARELQRAARAGDYAALARIARHHPEHSEQPQRPEHLAPQGLRLTAAQHVVAREHGFASWARLRRYVRIVTARSWTPDLPADPDEPAEDRFLRLACSSSGEDGSDSESGGGEGGGSYSSGGEGGSGGETTGRSDSDTARRLLAEHPDLPRRSLLVAAACADVAEVRRHLNERPGAASATGGPHGWSPLLYQAYARHDPRIDRAASLQTARLLLDAGADPNDGRFWHALPTPFTVLTGLLGHGEQARSAHPHALALARMLLEAGADPNDGQAIYNRMFGADDQHLVLLFEFGLGRETGGAWHTLLGESLESPSEMLRSLLAWAVAHDQRERVELLAAHGVDIVSPFAEQRAPRRRTPVESALVNGHRELADRLLALGALPPRLSAGDAFAAAVLAGDAEEVARTPRRVIATVRERRPGLMTWAAAQGAAESVALLAEAGFDVNALGRSDVPSNMKWHTALHVAAQRGKPALAATLLELGADPDIRDKYYDATPLDWARHFGHDSVAELLEPVTRADTDEPSPIQGP